MTPEAARTILKLAGTVQVHQASLIGFEPETKPLNPNENDSDAVLLATILQENRKTVETYIVQTPDGKSAAWVKTSQFWTLP